MSQATRTDSGNGRARAMSGEDKPHASGRSLWRSVAARRTPEGPRKKGAAVWGESGRGSWSTDPRGILGVANRRLYRRDATLIPPLFLAGFFDPLSGERRRQENRVKQLAQL